MHGSVAHATHLTRAHVSIAIAAGYLDEPPNLPGLAHLLEHVVTTAPLAASPNSSLLTWFAQHQGSLNAQTDDHVTDIHFTAPLELLEQAGLMAAAQLATPNIPQQVIHNEVAAIDAEWQARQSSSTMRELAAFAALADPQHIGAGCRHGNAQTLAQDLARLHNALAVFHQRHYHAGRVSIALISPWGIGPMIDLIQRMAALFKPPIDGDGTRMIAPRWGRLHSVDGPAITSDVASGMTLLWPLPPTLSGSQFLALTQLASAVNQGLLIEQLPPSLNDYCATAAPSGATDTFHLQLSGHLDAAQREALAVALSERLNSLLAALPSQDESLWQPPTNTEQLAPAWFTHARHQALARRFSGTSSTPPFSSSSVRFLVPDVSTQSKGCVTEARQIDATSIQRWCGHYGVSDDFPSLADTAWAACFIPKAMMTLAPLAEKRLARQGIVVQQRQLAQGSWVMTLGADAVAAMGTLLESASLTAKTPAHGLLAQQLLQRLMPFPDTPALWVSHSNGAEAFGQALRLLVSQPIAASGDKCPSLGTISETANASTAIMRTLRLPGTPAQRWLLALAEQYHSAAFFQQARYEHQLGYVAAVRRGDGAPCSLGYVVQTADNAEGVAATLTNITDRLWQTFDEHLPSMPVPPETPLAALITQWQSLLAGTTQPLHRLPWDQLALSEQLCAVGDQGRWQTHWLDSTGRYWVSDCSYKP
ncbi:MAG TPA: peptidase M16 [Halomonas sp.]|nr:peptidase M16 [Halomonas sp.]HEB06100.1 peptidase M16 [Halomonas sp.]